MKLGLKQAQTPPRLRFCSAEFGIYYLVGCFCQLQTTDFKVVLSARTDLMLAAVQAIGCAAWTFIPQGFQLSQRVSQAAAGSWDHGHFGLKPGWLFGLKQVCMVAALLAARCHASLLSAVEHILQDLSDIQWRVFREALPSASAALLAFVALSRVVGLGTMVAALSCQQLLHVRPCSQDLVCRPDSSESALKPCDVQCCLWHLFCRWALLLPSLL